jgi:DNA-binding PucR family transcriptional regulator
VRALLATEPVDVDSSEAILGYRLRQHHLGLVCWLGEAEAGGDGLARLEHATLDVAGRCEGRPLFLPQDEASAWAWLPLGTRDTFDLRNAEAAVAGAGAGVRFALGAIASGTPGFRRTHRQALSAQAVALAGPT